MSRIRVLGTAVCLTVAAAACGGGNTGSSTGGGSCDNKNPFVVGAIYDLSGVQALNGQQTLDGINFAVEDVNNSGGVLKRCVKVISKDSATDPTKAAQAARELVDQDNVEIIIGPITGSPTLSVLPITTAAKKVEIMGTAAADAGDASKYPYAFRTESQAGLQAQTIVDQIKKDGKTKIGLFAAEGATGTSQEDAIKQYSSANYASAAITAQLFAPQGTVDMTSQMRKLKDAGTDAVVLLFGAAPDLAAAIKARNALNWDVAVYGTVSLSFPEVGQAVGAAGMKNVFAGQIFKRLSRSPGQTKLTTAKGQAFLDRYKALKKQDPLQTPISTAAGGYDELMLGVTAVNKVGKNDPEKIRQYLEANGYDGLRAFYRYSPQRHDGVTVADISFGSAGTFKDGSLELAG